MPKRTDIRKILIIGSGPIVIGQACEFDYSGTQACKALKSLGYEIVLVNSNPATIMTDPETADVTYIEPLNVERLTQIIETERPDALLPNLGGQSGLNLCAALQKQGVLEQYGVEVIGVQTDAIERGEDRIAFKKTMDALGIGMARSEVAYTVEEALTIAKKLGYPVVLRPAYTMGGEGGGLVRTREELEIVCARGLQASLIGQVLVEESILGWEELELEVVRDKDNNMITVCFIENVDPVGVHTGDSFCTAPMLTIGEALQKKLQEQAYRIVEHIGVIGDTNVQFAHEDHGHAHDDHAHDDHAHGEDHEPCYTTWKPGRLDDADLLQAKMDGFSDKYLSAILDIPEDEIRSRREAIGAVETWRTVHVSGTKDSVYYYSTYCDFGEDADSEDGSTDRWERTESGRIGNHNENHRQKGKEKPKIMILGGGPNRIGQGIEFDYCCVHAAKELRAQGYETIMVNCNPETVSTDYDTSDKLYFEPLTLEDVLAIYRHENPVGVIAQFGGQTPLNLASALKANGVKILGTQPEVIDMAEDRDLFRGMMEKLHIPMPESGMATTVAEAMEIAARIGYPVMVRPSYVLGGRGMEIVYDDEDMKAYMEAATGVTPDRPVLIDRFLQHALECEADAIADGSRAFVPAVMEHIELAGIHSGDSACLVPSRHIPGDHLRTIREYTAKIAEEMHVVGLMNIQYAIEDDVVYVLEANPRASRTVPLVSKVCDIRMVPLAIDVITAAIGGYLSPVPELKRTYAPFYGVKQAVFPFNMFQEVDPVLGPEMRSTGEVLGLAETAGEAYLKSREAAGESLPLKGAVLISVNNLDKPEIPQIANAFKKCGYKLYATEKTCDLLRAAGIEAEKVSNLHDDNTDIIDLMEQGAINILINTPTGKQGHHDGSRLRKAAIRLGIPYLSTMAAARAAAEGLSYVRRNGTGALRALQSWNAYSHTE